MTTRYYADHAGTSELNLTELGLLADDLDAVYHTTVEWHIVHCVYYWKKLFRSRWTGIPVEPRFDSEGHIDHCMKVFLKTRERAKIGTKQGASLDSSVVVT